MFKIGRMLSTWFLLCCSKLRMVKLFIILAVRPVDYTMYNFNWTSNHLRNPEPISNQLD